MHDDDDDDDDDNDDDDGDDMRMVHVKDMTVDEMRAEIEKLADLSDRVEHEGKLADIQKRIEVPMLSPPETL